MQSLTIHKRHDSMASPQQVLGAYNAREPENRDHYCGQLSLEKAEIQLGGCEGLALMVVAMVPIANEIYGYCA
jgi:hypothetical protein